MTDRQTTSRRAILIGALALTATPAVSMAAAPDPIYAAIDRYRRADRAFLDHCATLAPSADDTPHMEALVNEGRAARLALANTVPTTLAGLAAVLKFTAEQTNELGELLFDQEEEREEARAFLGSIAKAAKALMQA